jgi:Transposase.
MVRYCWSLTSLPPSVRYLSPLPALKASLSDTFPGWQCAVSPTYTKTDARDAAIIAEAARTLPHALRTLKLADEQIAELSMLCGFDDDLAAQTTQASNRIREIHPALERVLGPRLDHPAVLDLLQRYPSPEKLASLGEKNWQPSSANRRRY